MIDPRELRIGNYVMQNEHWVSASQFPGDVFQFELAHFYDVDCGHLPPEALDPIPLDEEWLVKFDYSLDKKLQWYYQAKDYLDIMLRKNSIGTFTIFIDGIAENIFSLDVNHVHQLQNLYYALTGQELTIKENKNDI